MEKEVISFRDKVGKALMSLGVGLIFWSILIFVSWILTPLADRSQINIIKLLVALVLPACILIRLSLFTVKRDSD